jgi:hypothetical protein
MKKTFVHVTCPELSDYPLLCAFAEVEEDGITLPLTLKDISHLAELDVTVKNVDYGPMIAHYTDAHGADSVLSSVIENTDSDTVRIAPKIGLDFIEPWTVIKDPGNAEA